MNTPKKERNLIGNEPLKKREISIQWRKGPPLNQLSKMVKLSTPLDHESSISLHPSCDEYVDKRKRSTIHEQDLFSRENTLH